MFKVTGFVDIGSYLISFESLDKYIVQEKMVVYK